MATQNVPQTLEAANIFTAQYENDLRAWVLEVDKATLEQRRKGEKRLFRALVKFFFFYLRIAYMSVVDSCQTHQNLRREDWEHSILPEASGRHVQRGFHSRPCWDWSSQLG